MFNTQALTILGLILESLASIWTVRTLFFGYERRISETGKTFQQQIRKDKINGSIVLTLLGLGMFFQAIAIL